MADTVKNRILKDGYAYSTFLFTNKSDGTGESGVVKVDASSLLNADNTATPIICITSCIWSITPGKSVELTFDGSTPATAIVLSGSGSIDFINGLGEINNDATEPTGDIAISTINFANNDTYSIILETKKETGFIF